MDLSEDEVSQLQTLIKKGKHKARTLTRAHILLMACEGEIEKSDRLHSSSPYLDRRADAREICHRWVRFRPE